MSNDGTILITSGSAPDVTREFLSVNIPITHPITQPIIIKLTLKDISIFIFLKNGE